MKAYIKYLDYIPLIILFISSIVLLVKVVNQDYSLWWKNYIGFLMLAIIILTFVFKHQVGVLMLGLTLFLGLFNLITFNPLNETFSTGIGNVTLFKGNPIFLLWLIIYFVLSGRYYVGILTKAYWQNLV